MKTGIGSLQGVIFIGSLDLSDKLQVAQSLSNLKSVKFDGNPTILPIPKDAPLELPRIILRTTDNLFNLNVSPNRIDLFFNSNKFDQEGIPVFKNEDLEVKFTSIMQEVAGVLLNKFSASIPRLALVFNYLVKLNVSSKKYLADNFIKFDALQNPDEMQLNFLLKKELNKYKSNEWIRFNSLRNQKNQSDDSAIILVLDFNTLAEIDYKFNKDSAVEYIKACFSTAKMELEQYTFGGKKNG